MSANHSGCSYVEKNMAKAHPKYCQIAKIQTQFLRSYCNSYQCSTVIPCFHGITQQYTKAICSNIRTPKMTHVISTYIGEMSDSDVKVWDKVSSIPVKYKQLLHSTQQPAHSHTSMAVQYSAWNNSKRQLYLNFYQS